MKCGTLDSTNRRSKLVPRVRSTTSGNRIPAWKRRWAVQRTLASYFLAGFTGVSIALAPTDCRAARAWTDGNGDGLPDQTSIQPFLQDVSVGVWIDTESYAFTQFQVWISLGSNSNLSFLSGTYVISGGTLNPVNTSAGPDRVGFTGYGFPPQHGTLQIANATFHLRCRTRNGTVNPVIDLGDAPYSILLTGNSYQAFSSASGTNWVCNGCCEKNCCDPPAPTESKSWGLIKGLYR